MIEVFALLGNKALYLLYAWLTGAIVASYLSERKGYGERPGLATGLLTSLVAIPIWFVWPSRADSKWRLNGPFPGMRGTGQTVADARAHGVEEAPSGAPAAGTGDTPGKATAALVLGICGLFIVPPVCSTLAMIFGFQAMRQIEVEPGRGGRGMAQAGYILGMIGLTLTLLVAVAFFFVAAT